MLIQDLEGIIQANNEEPINLNSIASYEVVVVSNGNFENDLSHTT